MRLVGWHFTHIVRLHFDSGILYAISIMPPALFLVGKQDEKHERDSGIRSGLSTLPLMH